ncbi:hypothetical protein ACJJIG_04005 [Microbulbifer sp. SSSA007]|uniref:hypothetical protein n=1 Tax=unclassified Microbulbifer TaxID=2619833 RepID=UPI00403A2365
MKKLILPIAIALSYSSITSAAGIASSFDIEYVRIDESGKGHVKFKSDLNYEPADCTASNYKDMLAFDTNENGGAAIYSMLLAAQAQGKKIHAVGTSSCKTYSQIENWSWGYIVN